MLIGLLLIPLTIIIAIARKERPRIVLIVSLISWAISTLWQSTYTMGFDSYGAIMLYIFVWPALIVVLIVCKIYSSRYKVKHSDDEPRFKRTALRITFWAIAIIASYIVMDRDHVVFHNTHPTIIEQEVFDKVQELRGQRHRRTKTGKTSLFSGLAYCADCKQKMYYCTTSYFEKRQDFFICSAHRHKEKMCSGHYIRAVVLEEMVWMHMETVISYVTQYEAHFRGIMEREMRLASEESIRVCKKRLAHAEKRLTELDRLFIRLYEDNVSSKVSDERFAMMSKTYEDEQRQLKVDVRDLQQEIDMQERQIENLDQFIQKAGKYAELRELTHYALRELVKAVYVDAPDKSSGKRRQGIHICYDLVGFIPLDTLMKQETA